MKYILKSDFEVKHIIQQEKKKAKHLNWLGIHLSAHICVCDHLQA